jgi:hypothetical protein
VVQVEAQSTRRARPCTSLADIFCFIFAAESGLRYSTKPYPREPPLPLSALTTNPRTMGPNGTQSDRRPAGDGVISMALDKDWMGGWVYDECMSVPLFRGGTPQLHVLVWTDQVHEHECKMRQKANSGRGGVWLYEAETYRHQSCRPDSR